MNANKLADEVEMWGRDLLALNMKGGIPVIEGAKLDTHYPHQLVVLYFYPLWRILLVATLITASFWCHRLGIMMAFSVFFYFMDMQLLLYKEV